MAKHLSLSDRIIIERGINDDLTFATIARILDRSPSSISREIKRYRVFIKSNRAFNGNNCTKRPTCLHNKLCSDAPRQGCWLSRCKTCPDYKCYEICPDYESPDFVKLDKSPYVYTGCDKQKRCRKNHAYYSAQRANSTHQRTVRDAHKGIRMSPEELQSLDELIEPLIKKDNLLIISV